MKQSPWKQASTNKYALLDWLYKKPDWTKESFPLSSGHAVLLPDMNTFPYEPEPGIDEDITITWVQHEQLAQKLDQCSQDWQRKFSKSPNEHDIERVRAALMPEFVYGDRLRDRIGMERRELMEREKTTPLVLEFISNRRKALIAGCAGAGKTTLAVAKAKELALEGCTVLLLAYNEAIATYLALHLQSCPTVHVRTLNAFCRDCCETTGIPFPEARPADTEEWWSRLCELLDTALSASPGQYDALVVDEAQDFQCTVWLALERAIRPEGWYYIFYDPEQNVFSGDMQFPIKDLPFLLQRNCRSTKAIVAAIAAEGIKIKPMDGLPDGEPIISETGESPGACRRAIGKILHKWIRNEGLTENQIVLLGAHSIQNTSLGESNKAGSFKVEERGEPRPGVIPYYSYMAFKGCEADAIILVDVDKNDKRWNKSGLYTAMSRARHLLGICYKR